MVGFADRAAAGAAHICDADIAAAHLELRHWQRNAGQAVFAAGIGSSQADLSDITGHFLATGGLFNLVVADGELAGFCAVRRDTATTGTLKRFAILQRWHRRGVGTMLLAATLADARSTGFDTIELVTGWSEQAFNMYLAAGFVPVDCEPVFGDHVMRLDMTGTTPPAAHICELCEHRWPVPGFSTPTTGPS